MKIAFIDPSDWDYRVESAYEMPMGGSQSALCYLAEQLAQQGHDIFVFNQTSNPGISRGVQCFTFPLNTIPETVRRSLDVAIILNVAGKGIPLRQFFGDQIRLILWTQQLPTLHAMQPLQNPQEREVYDGFAFVSEWQRHQFEEAFGIHPSRSAILRNAIAPAFQNLFPPNTSILSHKSHPPILAYTSTPFRGLDLLLSIFPKIRQAVPGTLLKVFSSKKVYQLREDIDESVYGSLYQRCRDMEGVEYWGSVSQPELAQQLRSVSILTYPNTFKETSCIAVMEAMASGCRVVTSNLAALTETAAGFCPLVSVEDVQGFSSVRDWQFSLRRDWQNYANRFVETTVQAIVDLQELNAESQLQRQLNYIQTSCTWEVRATTWIDWLSELCGLNSPSPPPEIPPISIAQTLTEQAKNAYHQGEFKQAIHLCQEGIKLNPQATEPYQILGESFQKSDKLIEASRAYATALNLLESSEIDPTESLPLREQLGRILYEIGDIEAAIACWQALIAIKPDSAAAYHNLGLLLELDNQLNKAIAFYQRAIALQPDSADIYFKLVNALMQSGQLLEAVATCRKALTLNPNLAATYFPGASVAASGHFSPQVWKDSQQLSLFNSQINYTQIYPQNQVQLAPPQTLSPPLHSTFHIKTGTSSAAFVVELMNGRAWGDRANSIVLTEDHALVADVSTGDAIVALFACLNQYPPVTQFPGNVAFLSQQAGGDYYHWMVDVLPRLELLRQGGWSWDKIDIFVVNGLQNSFQEATLKALGIPLDKIVTSQQYPHIQANRLLVPSLPTHPPKWAGNFIDGVPHWVCQFLRETFLPKFPQKTDYPERIYISRQQATRRRVRNEEQVIAVLKPLGFTPVTLESLSLAEQVALLATAQVVIAPHGAGLTNLMFCAEGTTVVELFSPRYVSRCYWILCDRLKLKYYYLLGKPLAPNGMPVARHSDLKLPPYPIFEDMAIDLEALKSLVQSLGI